MYKKILIYAIAFLIGTSCYHAPSNQYEINIIFSAENFNPLLRIAPIAWDIIEININEFSTEVIIEDFHLLAIENPKIIDITKELIIEEIINFLYESEQFDMLEYFINEQLVNIIKEKIMN